MTSWKLISQNIYNESDSWHFREIREYPATTRGERNIRLRANVKRNAYADQSFVRIEQWSDVNGWLIIESFPINDYDARILSYVMRELTSEYSYALDATADQLFEIAEAFIGYQTEALAYYAGTEEERTV